MNLTNRAVRPHGSVCINMYSIFIGFQGKVTALRVLRRPSCRCICPREKIKVAVIRSVTQSIRKSGKTIIDKHFRPRRGISVYYKITRAYIPTEVKIFGPVRIICIMTAGYIIRTTACRAHAVYLILYYLVDNGFKDFSA